MNALQLFEYENRKIRVVQGENGEPWFVAADVAEVLGYMNPRDAVSKHCMAPQILTSQNATFEIPNRGMTIIPERDVYRLIMRSKLPKAQEFEEWVVGTVLPSIRKRGGYLTPTAMEAALNDPDFIIRLATSLKEERAKCAALEAQTAQDKPKVLFADAVSASHSSILVGDLSKLIRQNGVDIGQNRLFQWLRENGYLIKRHGDSWNMPTQTAMDAGFFEVKERVINKPDGSSQITRTTKVTGKGQVHIINAFLAKSNGS